MRLPYVIFQRAPRGPQQCVTVCGWGVKVGHIGSECSAEKLFVVSLTLFLDFPYFFYF